MEVLEHHREQGHILLIIILFDVNAIEGDIPLCWVVETAEQLGHGGFAAAVAPHHCQALADFQCQVQMADCPVCCARILE